MRGMQLRRRHAIIGLVALFSAAGSVGRLARAQSASQLGATLDPDAMIRRAFELRDEAVAAGDQPYGALVARGGMVIGEGPSRVVTNTDPTAHAEMESIRDAARNIGSRDLSGAILYSSSRPCRMCESAAYWANIGRMVHGRDATDAGAPRYS
jgi:tRNA(Arg) A34 adenosine deaminase TadA